MSADGTAASTIAILPPGVGNVITFKIGYHSADQRGMANRILAKLNSGSIRTTLPNLSLVETWVVRRIERRERGTMIVLHDVEAP